MRQCGTHAHTRAQCKTLTHARTHSPTTHARTITHALTRLRTHPRNCRTGSPQATHRGAATDTHARTHAQARTHARTHATPRHATPPPTSAKEVDTSLQGGGGGEGGGGEGDRCAGEGVRRGCVMHTQKSTCVCNVLHVTHLDGQADNFDQIGRQWWGWRKSLLHLRL